MRITLVAAGLSVLIVGLVQAQSPKPNLRDQGNSPMQSPAPSVGIDEVAARRKLEDAGYRDLRGMTGNPDGTLSAKATRRNSVRPAEITVEIDSSGNIKER